MHLRPRAIAPGIPLVSISVSFVALRLLSWAEPKVLTGKSSDAAAFAGPSLGNQRQHSRSRGLKLFPWAQAVPLDVPMAQGVPPSVVDDLLKRDADAASRTSGELSYYSHCCCMYSYEVQITYDMIRYSYIHTCFRASYYNLQQYYCPGT